MPIHEPIADVEVWQRGKLATPQSSTAYGFSTDAGLLHQYALLCQSLFNHAGGLSNAHGRILVAHRSRQCIGGMQLTISYPRQVRPLPCEQAGFNLRQRLPELDLYNVVYGELSDAVALPEYQNDAILEEMLCQAVNNAACQGAQYLFMMNDAAGTMRWRRLAEQLTLPHSIRCDIALPEYEDLAGANACLLIFDLTAAHPLTGSGTII